MSIIYIASDHGGFNLKTFLVQHLKDKGHDVHDLGPSDPASCDYPHKAQDVAAALLKREDAFGILVCGTGIGMSMAANRIPGIRAAVCTNEFHARYTRLHNNANIICLGERVTGPGIAADMVDIFLSTQFEGGRHLRRINLFDK
ncbi:MAG: ribose 5-phosphate isomerase B [Mailhella sp.]|nr:ribose 5-phosphate isomerase B [Mailhella sp.]MBQ9104701.1 ribose 5-phosphate isomerase B [Mailhella sp.]